MNRMIPLAALLAATAIAAGCNKGPGTSTAYNNSGTSATSAQPTQSTQTADNGSPTVSTTVTTSNTGNQADSASAPMTSAATTPDTASASIASTAAPADNTSPGTASGAVSETVTTGKIKAAIAADSAMKDSDISVSTKDGVVTLNGTVKSQDQISIATNLAQRQEGVQRVESNISVR
jgi:hyperosmotically inducible protein